MNKRYLIILFVSLLCLTGCGLVNKITNDSASKGNMIFSLNLASIVEVTTVDVVCTKGANQTTTSLPRAGNQVSGNISLSVGIWNISLQAKNNNGYIIYEGNQNIEVTAGNTSTANIFLSPYKGTLSLNISNIDIVNVHSLLLTASHPANGLDTVTQSIAFISSTCNATVYLYGSDWSISIVGKDTLGNSIQTATSNIHISANATASNTIALHDISQGVLIGGSFTSTSYSYLWKTANYNSILDVAFYNNMVYLTDQAGDTVHKINKTTGLAISSFTGSFRACLYMATNNANNIWIADNQHNQIKLYNTSNTLLQTINTADPAGLAVNSLGNIYVAATYGGTISIYSAGGAFISSFGGATTTNENGKFTPCSFGNTVADIAIDKDDNVYVTDLGRRIIQKFNKDGQYITSFGSFVSCNYLHMGIAIDSHDYIYVTDVGGGKVKKYYKDGSYICEFGSQGSGNGQLNYPLGLCVDNDGNVYVGDGVNLRVQCFKPSN